MFDFSSSPCVFEPRYVPLRYSAAYCDPYVNERVSRRASNLHYEIEENRDSYVLSLHKQISREIVNKAIQSRLMEYAASYEPRYELVSDFFGNSYYVRRSVSESKLLNEAMQSIDMRQLGKNLAQQAFEDYSFTLSRDGCRLVVESCHEGLRAFEVENPLANVVVDSIEMDNNCIATLKLVLAKRRRVELANIPAHIKWNYIPQFNVSECGTPARTTAIPCATEVQSGEREDKPAKEIAETEKRTVIIPVTFKKSESVAPVQERKAEEEKSKQEKPEKKELSEETPSAKPVVTRPLLVPEQASGTNVEANENAVCSDDEKEVPSLPASRTPSRAHSVTLENVEDEEIKRWRRASAASQNNAIVQ